MNNQRVKVKVEDLIKRIEDCKKTDQAKYEKELKKYNDDNEKYVGRVKEALRKALTGIEATGKVPETYWGDLKIRVPDKPSKPDFRPKRYDEDINLLKMAADPTIIISTNSNYAKYL